jgi:hypothetical protein
LKGKVADSDNQVKRLERSISDAQRRIAEGQVVLGERAGAAMADLTEKAKQWSEAQLAALREIETSNPLGAGLFTDKLNAAVDSLDKAVAAAAEAGVNFDATTIASDKLNVQLNRGQITAKKYADEIKKLAVALKAQADAAKEAAKVDPVARFKQSVIGAEGTGRNQMGSSANGFGQFINGTWLSYFNKLFPDKASLSDAAKLAYRNVRQVAEAVIDKATDDYKAVLTAAGQKITAAGLYTVHVLGAPDAKKFFAASPNTDTSSFLSKQVLAQNPFLKGTVAQASAALAKRIGDSSAAVSQGAVAIAQAMQQEKEREAQYQAQKDAVSKSRSSMRASRLATKEAQDIWAFETAANIAAHKHTDDQIAAQEVAGKLLPQEAEELRKINDRAREIPPAARRPASPAGAVRAGRAEFPARPRLPDSELSGRGRSCSSRRRRSPRLHSASGDRGPLIDLQFAEERLKNQYIIDWAERVKNNKDATDQEKADAALAAQIAQMHQGTLDQRQTNAHSQNQQQNASPLQSFFQSIPNTADEINDALESIAVHGLQTFNDALTDAIVHFSSLGDVGRAALQGLEADLIKLALQLIEQQVIGATLGTAAIGATTAQAAAAGAAWAGPAALASLATLGANAGPAAAALASTTALSFALGLPKAAGGRIFGPGSDTSDNILTPSSPGEFMIKAASARAIGYDALEYINRHGALPFSPSNDTAAVAGGGGFGGTNLRELRGIVRDAILAMPNVVLHPVVDSGEIVRRGISTQTGSRAVIAHVGENATAYKSHLNRPGS